MALVWGKVDLVGKLRIVQLNFCFLGKAIFGDGLKCLLNVDCLLGRSLKVWNVVLTLTPALGSLGGHLNRIEEKKSSIKFFYIRNTRIIYRTILKVHLVANYNKGKVFRVARGGLNEKLVPPRVKRLERARCSNIVHQYATVSTTVESDTQRLEAFLSGGIPNLETQNNHQLVSEIQNNSS